jgi:hypothetical protein
MQRNTLAWNYKIVAGSCNPTNYWITVIKLRKDLLHWIVIQESKELTYLLKTLFQLHKKIKVDDHLHSTQSVCSTYLTARPIVNSFAINTAHLSA